MFLHGGKEYYPIEIRKIMGQNEKVIPARRLYISLVCIGVKLCITINKSKTES